MFWTSIICLQLFIGLNDGTEQFDALCDTVKQSRSSQEEKNAYSALLRLYIAEPDIASATDDRAIATHIKWVEESSPENFIQYLEEAMGAEAPVNWKKALLSMSKFSSPKIFTSVFRRELSEGVPLYHGNLDKTCHLVDIPMHDTSVDNSFSELFRNGKLWTVRSNSIRRTMSTVRVVIEENRYLLPLTSFRSISKNKEGSFDGCAFGVDSASKNSLVVAIYAFDGSPFPIACVEDTTGRILWKSECWAAGPCVLLGHKIHSVEIVEDDDRWHVCGYNAFHFYAETLNKKTGVRAYRFSSSNCEGFSE